MRLKRNELIAHPVRLRILTALSGRELSVDQLGELLDDVPTPTLYRQVALLIEGGLIEVTRTEGKTRLLTLVENASLLNRADVDPQSVEQNTHFVNTFFARQIAAYATACRDPRITPGDWQLRGFVAYLTPEEERELLTQIVTLLDAAPQESAPGRRRRTLLAGSLPDRELPNENP